jgi:methyltransferase-like protein/SAM-dependent methyltransferase
MTAAAQTLYDEVPYPSGLYPQTHPDRLATIASLLGMHPTPVERCRVLELGCNDGANIIAMAYALPQSHFVGIDLAARPVANGQAIIDELGLDNIVLRHLDLSHVTAELGRFDYIIAHGLYSWVPQTVRERLLAVCAEHLTDQGVAFVSYNVYPGSHFRDLTRGMMRYHVAKFTEPQQKVRQARALLKALAESKEKADPYHQILEQELVRAGQRSDAALFHDDLNEINQPVYFSQFIEHAARHGLQFLSEASLQAMQISSFAEHVQAVLNQMDATEILPREQYIDFLKCRPFRQTLLCRDGIDLDRTLQPKRLYGLRFAANLTPASAVPDLPTPTPEKFKNPAGAEIETDRPLVKIALACLGAIWPRSMSFNDLITSLKDQLGDALAGREETCQDLANALLQAHLAGHVEIHAGEETFVTAVSERPVASALARLQIRKGTATSTLRHQSINVVDSLGINLIQLLDGTRDRTTLLTDLAELIKSGSATVPGEGGPITDFDLALTQLSDGLDTHLADLARLGVLTA